MKNSVSANLKTFNRSYRIANRWVRWKVRYPSNHLNIFHENPLVSLLCLVNSLLLGEREVADEAPHCVHPSGPGVDDLSILTPRPSLWRTLRCCWQVEGQALRIWISRFRRLLYMSESLFGTFLGSWLVGNAEFLQVAVWVLEEQKAYTAIVQFLFSRG